MYTHKGKGFFKAKSRCVFKTRERFPNRSREMEERKQSGSSSFTSDLFGSKESSSSGIFGSIFAPPSKVLGRESVRSEGEGVEKKPDRASQYSHSRSGAPDNIPQRSEDGSQRTPNKDKNSYYQEEKVQPCHLSSSIYYGGQDIYSSPKSTQSSAYTTYKKDGGEDDSDSASRGNWWQGSLYY